MLQEGGGDVMVLMVSPLAEDLSYAASLNDNKKLSIGLNRKLYSVLKNSADKITLVVTKVVDII